MSEAASLTLAVYCHMIGTDSLRLLLSPSLLTSGRGWKEIVKLEVKGLSSQLLPGLLLLGSQNGVDVLQRFLLQREKLLVGGLGIGLGVLLKAGDRLV